MLSHLTVGDTLEAPPGPGFRRRVNPAPIPEGGADADLRSWVPTGGERLRRVVAADGRLSDKITGQDRPEASD